MAELADFVTEAYPDGTQRVLLSRLNDGRVMCCLCFEYVTRDRLAEADEPGFVWDICRPCKAEEDTAAPSRGPVGP